jgi:hypothetical protein
MLQKWKVAHHVVHMHGCCSNVALSFVSDGTQTFFAFCRSLKSQKIMDTADDVSSVAPAAVGDAGTKRRRIEHLIQRGDRLAHEQQERQKKTQCTPQKSSPRKTPKSSAVTQVFTARRSSWTPKEDEKLRSLVQQLGTQSWSDIAVHFPSRDRKRCRERFVNYLTVKSTAWTALEDEKLLQLQQTMGCQWAKMAKQFSGRSPESVKNRCLMLARRAADTRPQRRRQAPQKWTAAEQHKLKELVTAHGARNWLFIASQLPGRTDMQCLQQWHRTLDDKVVKGKGTWTQSEDRVLVDKVAQIGKKWTQVRLWRCCEWKVKALTWFGAS